MDPIDEYFCSHEEWETIDDFSNRSYLKNVKFRNWTPDSDLPQYAAAKIFLRKTSEHENEVNFLIKVGNCHTNIVKFYHAMVLPDNRYAIFMELCNKGSLAEIIYNRSHDPNVWTKAEVLSIFTIIIGALTSLHQAEIAHRDINPANIFVNQNNEIRIGDFGGINHIRQGIKNTAFGTPEYMSPYLKKALKSSMIRSSLIDSYKEDVWSAGKTLFEIATMNLGVDIGKTDKTIRERVVKDMRWFGYHDDAIEIILSMLITNKDNRPSMAEIYAKIIRLDLHNFEIPGFDPYLTKPKWPQISNLTQKVKLGCRTTEIGWSSAPESCVIAVAQDISLKIDEKDKYFSSYEKETVGNFIPKSLLLKVKFKNWTQGSDFPQWAAAKIFWRKDKKYIKEAKFLYKAGNCHRNIVKFYHDMILPDNKYAIFMEFCDKGSLASIIWNNRCNPALWTKDEVLNIFIIITEALTELHEEKIVHRDIKPDNIFVNRNNEIRIGDFGDTKKIRQGEKNTLRGTLEYMSPFLVGLLKWGASPAWYKSPFIDPYKEDVWSTGKTLFEIATMNLEVDIGKTDEKIRKTVSDDMKKCGYYDDVIEIILSMLIVNKNNRPSMAEVNARFKSLNLADLEIPAFDPYKIKKEPINYIATATISGLKWEKSTIGESKFVHDCGKETEIFRFISFVNEMIEINGEHSDVICMECKKTLSEETIRYCKNHFDSRLFCFNNYKLFQ